MSSLQGTFNTPLDILIVGGGLSGLATAISVSLAGHSATVFEAAPQPHPFGSGVVTCPNGTRLLSRWGIDGALLEEAGSSSSTSPITRWQLCDPHGTSLGPDLLTGHGDDNNGKAHQEFPPWTFHRLNLQLALLHRARDLGATVLFGARVTGLDDDDDDDGAGVKIQLEGGETHHGDLVVIAEGTHSRLRNSVLDRPVNPIITGYMAYRITVDRSMVHDAELRAFMDMSCIRTWVGKGSHIAVFPMRRGAQLSMMVLIPHSQLQQGAATNPTQELKNYLKGWDSLLSSMVGAAQRVNKWAAVHLPELPESRSPRGTCILVGDAANTMSPYLSQGLSLDLEDAGTIGYLLGQVRNTSQLPAATATYAGVRKARAQRIREETAVFESQLRATAGGGCRNDGQDLAPGAGSCHYAETGRLAQEWIWSYDAYAGAEEAFKSAPS